MAMKNWRTTEMRATPFLRIESISLAQKTQGIELFAEQVKSNIGHLCLDTIKSKDDNRGKE